MNVNNINTWKKSKTTTTKNCSLTVSSSLDPHKLNGTEGDYFGNNFPSTQLCP